jgi:hypothetical protein
MWVSYFLFLDLNFHHNLAFFTDVEPALQYWHQGRVSYVADVLEQPTAVVNRTEGRSLIPVTADGQSVRPSVLVSKPFWRS